MNFLKKLPYLIFIGASIFLLLNKQTHMYFKNFDYYEAIISLISIITAFNITAIALLYNAQNILGKLYQQEDKKHDNKLNLLSKTFKYSFIVNMISIIFLLLFPDSVSFDILFTEKSFELNKYIFVPFIVFLNCYKWYQVLDILLFIFALPPHVPRNKNN